MAFFLRADTLQGTFSNTRIYNVMARYLGVVSIMFIFTISHKTTTFIFQYVFLYKNLFIVFMKMLVINLYGINGWYNPNYNIECNGALF